MVSIKIGEDRKTESLSAKVRDQIEIRKKITETFTLILWHIKKKTQVTKFGQNMPYKLQTLAASLTMSKGQFHQPICVISKLMLSFNVICTLFLHHKLETGFPRYAEIKFLRNADSKTPNLLS